MAEPLATIVGSLHGAERATGVGSLPGADPGAALRMIERHCPAVPFWPQLPARGPGEAMLAQAAAAAGNGGVLPPAAGAGFHALCAALAAGRFGSARLIKGQLAGPNTCRSLAAKDLARFAEWQVLQLGRFGRPVVVVVDEPALPRDEPNFAALALVLDAIRAAGGHAGLHCCAEFDPAVIARIAPDLFSFDADHGLEVFLGHPAGRALAAGGTVVAYGLVSTDRDCGDAGAEELLCARFRAAAPPDAPALFTASCGLAAAPPARAERALACAAGLAALVDPVRGVPA